MIIESDENVDERDLWIKVIVMNNNIKKRNRNKYRILRSPASP